MEDANFIEQNNGHATSFALANLCAKVLKQALHVAPFDIRACRMREDGFEGALTFTLHLRMVLKIGTIAQVRYVSDGYCMN